MRRLAVVVAILVIALPVAADPSKRWNDMLVRSATALKAGEYEQALKISSKVVREMVDSLAPGDAEAQALAVAVTHKALAHAGLGDTETAVWYWQTAQAIAPAIAKSDLSMFGPLVEGLVVTAEPPTTIEYPQGTVVAPRIKKRVNPQIVIGREGLVSVETTIDRDGRVRSPRRVQTADPVLLYCALEAMRQWRFQPGTMGGEPVPVMFNITFNFSTH